MGNQGYIFDENVIEWDKGKKIVTLSLTNQKYSTKLKKLAEQYPDECDCYVNADGSVYGHVPLSYIKISHPKQMSEEQRKAASERLKKARKS